MYVNNVFRQKMALSENKMSLAKFGLFLVMSITIALQDQNHLHLAHGNVYVKSMYLFFNSTTIWGIFYVMSRSFKIFLTDLETVDWTIGFSSG